MESTAAATSFAQVFTKIVFGVGHFLLDFFQTSVHFLATLSPLVLFFCTGALIVVLLGVPLLSGIALLPYRLVKGILLVCGITLDEQRWSVVYDSVTKEPIDPAYVSVRDMQGKEVASMVTDLDGRFALLLPKGIYRIEVQKTHFAFPSYRLSTQTSDGYYGNLYFGQAITIVKDEEVITLSIPLDPVASDWNQAEKKRKGLFLRPGRQYEYRAALRLYYVMGTALLLSRYWTRSDAWVHQLVWVYIALFLGGILRPFFWSNRFQQSIVISQKEKKPLAFARVEIFNEGGNMVARKTTTLGGQFVCLLPRGRYSVKISVRTSEGIYTPLFTSRKFSANRGYLARKFEV